jgi:hypothetical protein
MRDGGASMWAILAFDMCAMLLVPVALIVSIVARARGKMRGVSLTLGVLALLSALVPMCAGVGGYMFGMSKVEDAVENVSADQKAVIMAAGESEASANLNLGFGSGCTCLLPAVLALLLVPPKREAFDD